MDIYGEQILEHWKNPKNFHRVKNPDYKASMHNPLCGDEIIVEIKASNGKISEIGFSGQGCIISQAAASILTQEAKKIKDMEKIKNFRGDNLLNLLGVDITGIRKKCALLSLEVLKRALATK